MILTYTIGGGTYSKYNAMDKSHEKTLINLKKAKSHIEKLISMIEEGEYCINVMQQNLAVIGLLKSAHQMLMEGHLNTCFKNAMKTNNENRKQEMVQEILRVTNLANK
jgi:DNA-binding FrmR family transcriptional regulator